MIKMDFDSVRIRKTCQRSTAERERKRDSRAH